MKLRFEVDQAECFRRGIDCPKSIVTIEVNPVKLPQDERTLIADRLDGIDVKQIDGPGRIIALDPTYESLIDAVRVHQRIIEFFNESRR